MGKRPAEQPLASFVPPPDWRRQLVQRLDEATAMAKAELAAEATPRVEPSVKAVDPMCKRYVLEAQYRIKRVYGGFA